MQRRKFIAASTVAVSASAVTALGVTAASALAATERTGKGFVVKAGQSRFGETTKLGGLRPNDIKISGKDTDGNLTVFEYIGREKGGPPLHVHPNQDEIFYVVEGEYAFAVGGEKHKLTPGETIFLPRNIPHTFAQLSDTGKMVFSSSRRDKWKIFFRKAGSFPGEPSPQEGAKLFFDHGLKVVGLPLSTK